MSIAKVLQDLMERAKAPLGDLELGGVRDYGPYEHGFIDGQQHALRVAVDEINKHLLGEDKT